MMNKPAPLFKIGDVVQRVNQREAVRRSGSSLGRSDGTVRSRKAPSIYVVRCFKPSVPDSTLRHLTQSVLLRGETLVMSSGQRRGREG